MAEMSWKYIVKGVNERINRRVHPSQPKQNLLEYFIRPDAVVIHEWSCDVMQKKRKPANDEAVNRMTFMWKIVKLENWRSHLTTTMLNREMEEREERELRIELLRLFSKNDLYCERGARIIQWEPNEREKKSKKIIIKMENFPFHDYYNLQHERISKICCTLCICCWLFSSTEW